MTKRSASNQPPGCLGMIQQALGLAPKAAPRVTLREVPPQAPPELFPYRLQRHFLSPAELNFHQVLTGVVSDRLMICPKVSLGDLFYPKTDDRAANTAWRNRIDRKHVDFLLCDPQTVRPLLGIELDDASHREPARQDRDQFVDEVFSAAGLPLYRVPVQYAYSTRDLAAGLARLLGPDTPLTAPDPGLSSLAPLLPEPACPQCGRPMVLRTVRRQGPHYGNQFWGCSIYPKCRGVLPLTSSPKSEA